MLDLLELEDGRLSAVSLSAAGPTALQRSNRGKCAQFLRDIDATADLPVHCPLFALQLQNLTHRWWSESEAPTLTRVMSIPWRQRHCALSCTPPFSLTRHHSSFQILGSWPALTALLTALAAYFWAGANPTTCHLCTWFRRFRLCMKLRSKTTFWFQ